MHNTHRKRSALFVGMFLLLLAGRLVWPAPAAAQSEGKTPCPLAAQLDDTKELRLLLDQRADIQAKDSQGKTALRSAAENYEKTYQGRADRYDYEPEDILRLLEQGASLAPEDNGGWNLLNWAISWQCKKTIQVILKRNPDVNARDKNGRTALMFAAVMDDRETIQQLFARGADVNLQDRFGMTALMYAAQHEWVVDTIQTLLRHGADRSLKDKEKGWTATQRADYFGNFRAAALLKTGVIPVNKSESKSRSRLKEEEPNAWLRIDSHRWLDFQLVSKSQEYPLRYRAVVIDRRGHRQSSVEIHSEESPLVKAFRDVDGRAYVYIETSYLGSMNGELHIASLYLVKGRKLFEKWASTTYGALNCTPLLKGGAIVWLSHGGEFNAKDPHHGDWVHTVYRLRNGVITSLGDAIFPETSAAITE